MHGYQTILRIITVELYYFMYHSVVWIPLCLPVIPEVSVTRICRNSWRNKIKCFTPQVSFDLAEYTADVDALGVLRLLDAIRSCKLEKDVKFYQASTSELYGKVVEIPQKETTPFYPRSPYSKSDLSVLYGNVLVYIMNDGKRHIGIFRLSLK